MSPSYTQYTSEYKDVSASRHRPHVYRTTPQTSQPLQYV
ncbi:hypothetical protein Vi05172_g11112 [Venturia inaequalis]|nr:hypothetical protein Vi05172_g11112 [Venturia inaequalis]